MTLIWSPRYTTTVADPDAQAYITAVEEADNAQLEYPVVVAIDEFVRGCKADGIWPAIKASCILAGARTLQGCLVPLVGTAPTRFGTEGGWNYNRKTGLAPNGTNNYLNSNRADRTRNNAHIACFVSALNNATATFRPMMSNRLDGDTNPQVTIADRGTTDNTLDINMQGTASPFARPARTTGFIGGSRSISTSFGFRAGGVTSSLTAASNAVNSQPVLIYARPSLDFGTARLSFYSIGESLDIALLDARVIALMKALAAAIP